MTQFSDFLRADDTLNVSTKCGQIPYHHFDSVFFGVNQKLAINMDPVSKLSYVRSYEAILDAGMYIVLHG